jgi:hypothetical protein
MDWLADPEIQKIIAFFAGGLAAIVAAAWAVFKYFHSSRERAAPPPSHFVTADRGSKAAGRDLIEGIPPEHKKKRG